MGTWRCSVEIDDSDAVLVSSLLSERACRAVRAAASAADDGLVEASGCPSPNGHMEKEMGEGKNQSKS